MNELVILMLKIASAVVIPIVFITLFVGTMVLLMILFQKLYIYISGIKTNQTRISEELERIRNEYDDLVSKCSADMEFLSLSESYKNILIRRIEGLMSEMKAGRLTSEDFATRAEKVLTEYENDYKKFKIHYDSKHSTNHCPCQK